MFPGEVLISAVRLQPPTCPRCFPCVRRVFFQAEDGIRDVAVTGVQTCALPIYREKVPVIVIGGGAGNFLGEYMAGGIIILLGLHKKERSILPFSGNPDLVGNYTGTGMHGGKIYIRANIEDHKLGKEVKKSVPDKDDLDLLDKYITAYCNLFNINRKKISNGSFLKLVPYSNR